MLQSDFYTAQELAEKLKLNVMSVYRYIKTGKLEAHKIGKEYRITTEAFTKFLDHVKTK